MPRKARDALLQKGFTEEKRHHDPKNMKTKESHEGMRMEAWHLSCRAAFRRARCAEGKGY